jgi:hypothetical protein
MGMPVGASRSFSTPVSTPVAAAPPPPPPPPSSDAAAAATILSADGPLGTKVNKSA